MMTAGKSWSATPRWRAVLGLAVAGCVLFTATACIKGRAYEGPALTSQTAAPAGIPTYHVSVSKFTYSGMPDTVPSDTPFRIVFSNKESFEITHEMVVIQIPDGKTLDDVINDAKANGPDSEDNWLHFGEIGEVNTGATGVASFDLPPGNYAIACWQDGAAGGGTGPLHLTIGMAQTFTAS